MNQYKRKQYACQQHVNRLHTDTSTAWDKDMAIASILKTWVYRESLDNAWSEDAEKCQPFYFWGVKCWYTLIPSADKQD